MTQYWLRSRWQGNPGKAGVRASLGRETKVLGTQTRQAKVTHPGGRHRTPVNSNNSNSRNSSSTSNLSNSNNLSNNPSSNLSNSNSNRNSNSISRSTSSSKG